MPKISQFTAAMVFKVLSKTDSGSTQGCAAGDNRLMNMVEAPTLTLATDERSQARRSEPAPAARLRSAFFILLATVTLGAVIWSFVQFSSLAHVAAASASSDNAFHVAAGLYRMRWITPLCILGAGGLLFMLMRTVFAHIDKSWERANAEQQITWESTATRLRSQLAEKITAEDAALQERREIELKLATLTRLHEETIAELNQRKTAEKTMAQQRQQLAASKDVLQVHVQARSEELQKLQRQSELILNSVGEGICGCDSSGKIAFANPVAAKLLGFEIKELIGKKESEIFVSSDQAGQTTGDGHLVELQLNRRDGSVFAAEFTRSIIREGERTVGHVVLFKDITERKSAEHSLARKVEELARSNAELEQFAFVASHDLQEPLRKIRAFGDRLKMKCEAALTGDGLEYLERMQNAAARMQTLIADLLTFSRVISRTEPFTAVDLNVITREVIGDLEVRIEKCGGKVEVGQLPTIEADAMQMRQLIQNLLSNALKFHAPGSKPLVQITSRTLETEPGVRPACEISVRDNGIGFDEQYLEKVFAVFQRLHGRQEYEGTGIGLAVCRRITDRHGGSITARSKPGEGATFIFTLPFSQTSADKPSA